eukprot:349797-Hanusia_phi.AAC.1
MPLAGPILPDRHSDDLSAAVHLRSRRRFTARQAGLGEAAEIYADNMEEDRKSKVFGSRTGLRSLAEDGSKFINVPDNNANSVSLGDGPYPFRRRHLRAVPRLISKHGSDYKGMRSQYCNCNA